MALRPESEGEEFRVVGASMVHGLMHAENFSENQVREVYLV